MIKDKIFLRQVDLARRWSMSERTLERWRWLGEGPRFFKKGGIVRYHVDDILTYEQEHFVFNTSKPLVVKKN